MMKKYQRYLKLEKNFTGNTIEAYMRDVQKLLDYLKGEGKEPTEVVLEDLQHFAASLHDIGVGARSQCRILSGVRTFYRFLVLDGWMEDDPSLKTSVEGVGRHIDLTAQVWKRDFDKDQFTHLDYSGTRYRIDNISTGLNDLIVKLSLERN